MGKADLINQLFENQRTVNRFMRQDDPDIWMESNLTVAQVKSLFFISSHNEVNFRILAKALKVTPSNVTGIIDRLSEQGLVSREDNPQDRRMLMLKMTAKGNALMSNLRERRINLMSNVLNRMNDDQLKTVAEGFALLSAAVKDLIDEQ